MGTCAGCGATFEDRLSKKGEPYTKCRTCYRAGFKEMLWQQQQTRAHRDTQFSNIWAECQQRATEAAKAVTPVPMTVEQHLNPLDDCSPVKQSWHVPEGACGFAYVHLMPATHSFCRWLGKQLGKSASSYYGGIMVDPVMLGTQSLERREAGCCAAIEYLKSKLDDLNTGNTKLRVYLWSKLD